MTTVTYPAKRGNKAPSKFKTDKVKNEKVPFYRENTMDSEAFSIYTKSGAKTYRDDGDKGSFPTSEFRSRRP